MKLPANQNGFTMIEVLVSLLILALGLLGVAGLQMQGTRHVYDAYQHSIAVIQAQDMADRMRANLTGVRDNYYSNISTTPADPGCISSSCTSANLAQYDAFRWNSDNASLLPSGQGAVACTDINATTATLDIGSTCTITVRWDSARNGATGTGCDPAVTTDLRCVRLTVAL